MASSLVKGFLFTFIFICVALADSNNTQDIVDIVDYRFDKIRDNINSDIGKIKGELKKIKDIQDKTIEQELSNIDIAIDDLEEKLIESLKDKEKYNSSIVKQDKKIDNLSSSFEFWAVGILFVGFFTAIISFFISRFYLRKAREDAAKEVNIMLNRWIKKRDTEYIEGEKRENKKEDELNKQIEFWKSRYEELRFNDDHLLAEFKRWAKSIEDKEIKNRIKKYIKKLKKENRSKTEPLDS